MEQKATNEIRVPASMDSNDLFVEFNQMSAKQQPVNEWMRNVGELIKVSKEYFALDRSPYTPQHKLNALKRQIKELLEML